MFPIIKDAVNVERTDNIHILSSTRRLQDDNGGGGDRSGVEGNISTQTPEVAGGGDTEEDWEIAKNATLNATFGLGGVGPVVSWNDTNGTHHVIALFPSDVPSASFVSSSPSAQPSIVKTNPSKNLPTSNSSTSKNLPTSNSSTNNKNEYRPPDDDHISNDDDYHTKIPQQRTHSDWADYTPKEMEVIIKEEIDAIEHDKYVRMISVSLAIISFLFMLFIAQQMIENPNGYCAKICRIAVGLVRCLLYPIYICICCKCFCFRRRRHHTALHNTDDDGTTYRSDLELS